MHRAPRLPRTNEFTIGGSMLMLGGALVYLIDDVPSGRHNWHLFRTPAIILLAVGVLLAFVGRLTERSE